MRWPDGTVTRLRALVGKECRELVASRAALVYFAVIGLLVGNAHIAAVETYAEMSGAAGGPAALPQGLSPLDGFVVPVFGAYAIAATFLFPFVCIRQGGAERERGALQLLLQAPVGAGIQMGVKAIVLLLAWLLSWVPGLLALALWSKAGGHLSTTEVAAVLLGHAVRGVLVVALSLLAVALTDSAASAAIVALALSVGSFALDFTAQVRGGTFTTLAQFTPEAVLRTFERGEVRVDVFAVASVLAICCMIMAAWLGHPGRPIRARLMAATVAVVVAIPVAWSVSRATASWDWSQDRRNSFARADEVLLRTIREPLRIDVNLAPEDPRLADLERAVLRKLRRTMPDVQVRYAARTSTGLFEQPGDKYGEVWYRLGARSEMTRSTTEPIVLETIFHLAGLVPPAPSASDEAAYSGYPLRAQVGGARPLFYVVWPLIVLVLWMVSRRRTKPQARNTG